MLHRTTMTEACRRVTVAATNTAVAYDPCVMLFCSNTIVDAVKLDEATPNIELEQDALDVNLTPATRSELLFQAPLWKSMQLQQTFVNSKFLKENLHLLMRSTLVATLNVTLVTIWELCRVKADALHVKVSILSE